MCEKYVLEVFGESLEAQTQHEVGKCARSARRVHFARKALSIRVARRMMN